MEQFIDWLNLIKMLKPYIDMNRDIRKKKQNNYFEKYFFKFMNNAFFLKDYRKYEKT